MPDVPSPEPQSMPDVPSPEPQRKELLVVLIVLAYFIGIHVVEGYVLVPRIMGRAIGLHPAITLLAVIAGNELLGLMGAILAGPLAGLIQSVLASFWLYYRETHQTQFADSRQPAQEREHEQK